MFDAYEKLESLIRGVEKANTKYEELTRRAEAATGKHELISVYNEVARFAPDMATAAAILEIVEGNGDFESTMRSKGINAEAWAPYVRAYVMDPEKLTGEINDRIFVIYREEDAAER